ncbi:MAG: hypothetical protein FJ143_13755, partial [Deltaproteobacteria bacterium]|nr:hypothetical protein [Deltaproteobacteria bacterium]
MRTSKTPVSELFTTKDTKNTKERKVSNFLYPNFLSFVVRKYQIAICVLAALAVSVSVVTARAQEREKIRVSTLFVGSSLIPFWIGREQGIFAKHGIDVELIWMQSNLSTAAL